MRFAGRCSILEERYLEMSKMEVIRKSQGRFRGAFARCDITPPVGIYHRMWGAALHDRATGVHRPLEATLLWLEPYSMGTDVSKSSEARILVSLDHCILDPEEIEKIRESIHRSTGIDARKVLVTLTHTHGAGWMSRTRSGLPGGELLGPYLDQLANQLGLLAKEASSRVQPMRMVVTAGRCELAAHRDFFDEERQRFVCGLNPEGQADDTLLIAKLTDETGECLGTIVNYACHPTTLAWENTLISPDWVGAMRETIEREQGGVCLFLQGASGDLGPREGFVGDPAVADRNGKQVGFAALSAIATLPAAGTEYRYAGPVISGTAIGTWQHVPVCTEQDQKGAWWRWEELVVDLPYRHDLPTIEQTRAEMEHWLGEESKAREASDLGRVRDCRAQVEQRTRQLNRLTHLEPGRSYPLRCQIGILGDVIWVFLPGELYQIFQVTLRERFRSHAVFVTTLTNDWQPGYIPPASVYGYEIYQEVIAATSPGSLECLIEAITRKISHMNAEST
jgi:hypothetical protein